MIDKTTFLTQVGKLLDQDAHYAGTGSRTLVESERTVFIEHLWDLFDRQGTNWDFTSPQFFVALQTAQRRHESIQDQAAALQALLQPPTALTPAAPAKP